ncbi:MAG TPA: aminotransferase class I/II-fold pyridoxal phosphate-dependent enzyme [Bacteroidia bacterium]|jgi:(S)-3,5-dihydroxyphenylglycine transaminase|nr:aminotransferase class I/II-fold pyridoxal phosphate-dependent enzyme [Bacteroidia bacterium]
MTTYIINQDYNAYSDEDQETWRMLCQRQSKLPKDKVSKEYLEGFNKLKVDKNRIEKIDELSKRLEAISGWTLVPVSGLLPTRDFFYMIINKRYPVTVSVRKPFEMDFSEQPDAFHDICGHMPLLTNAKFTKFLTAYSIIAMKYVNHDRAVDILGRLYWFTYEMGILNENGGFKPYGGAVITSAEEIANVQNAAIPKHTFDLDHIFRTEFSPFSLQKEYFVIDSFDDLFNCLENIESKLLEHLLLPEQDLVLRNYALNTHLSKGFNNVIGFLNDIQYKFPKAISFVAGQPDERFFEIENHLSKVDLFVEHMMENTGASKLATLNKINQYNKTKGIVNNLVAQYLKNDENIHIHPDNILMTVGAQEAFGIIVSTICNRESDVILVENPSYIGLSSFAKVFNYNIEGIDIDEEGIDLQQVKSKILEINSLNKRVKLLYVIPDYQNPSGSCMPIGSRLKLLELALQYNFLIIEDCVYNSFTYAQKKNPTLKSLDKHNRVIYVGSFSKSLFPGLRIGLIAADQKIENDRGENIPIIDEMCKVKAQLTNNTSSISQSILGGVLLDLNCSLSEWSKPKFESYKIKQQKLLSSLDKYIGTYKEDWAEGIFWNKPEGGFFIKMTLPFPVDSKHVSESAARYNVIFCPMRYFYLNGGGENEIRLTFSNLSLEIIESGIKQLASYLKSRVKEIKTMEKETLELQENF